MQRKLLNRGLLAGLVAILTLPTALAAVVSWSDSGEFVADPLSGAAGDDFGLRVAYNNAGSSVTTYGIKVEGASFTTKGGEIGVSATAAKSGSYDPQKGSAAGRLASVSGYDASGHFQGVYGVSTPTALDNFDATTTSTALGGAFYANPSTLTLDNGGTYWVGGTLGQVSGTINGGPGLGAVAGVIGISTATGTAKSWAGYFKGDVKVTGDVNAGSLTLVPNGVMACNAATRGKMQVVAGTPDVLQVCLQGFSAGSYAWVTIA